MLRKQGIAPVYVDGAGVKNGLRIDSNAIASAFGKGNAVDRLLKNAVRDEKSGKIGVFYINIKKAAGLLKRAGLQLPGRLFRTNGYIHSIRDAGSPVNMKFSDVTETKQFKRWFGDWKKHPRTASKIVNADGTPKRVYHGTDKEFRVFRSESGLYWFSESRDYAEAMAEERGGDRVEEVYLNIRNPYYAKLEPGKFSDPNYEKALIREAKKRGCDGLIIQNDTDNELEAETFYVAFKPNQIKSATDNVGTFSTETEDINGERRG